MEIKQIMEAKNVWAVYDYSDVDSSLVICPLVCWALVNDGINDAVVGMILSNTSHEPDIAEHGPFIGYVIAKNISEATNKAKQIYKINLSKCVGGM